VENALATLESLPGRVEPVTPSADQASQTLAGLGRQSLTYQAAAGLNADIGFTQSLMLRDELVAAAEWLVKVTFEAAMKPSRVEADQLRKERDDTITHGISSLHILLRVTLGTSSLHIFMASSDLFVLQLLPQRKDDSGKGWPWRKWLLRLPAVGTLKGYSKALEYEYRVKTVALSTLK
jgi:hypothetical protein